MVSADVRKSDHLQKKAGGPPFPEPVPSTLDRPVTNRVSQNNIPVPDGPGTTFWSSKTEF
jgi:hypothetical protein